MAESFLTIIADKLLGRIGSLISHEISLACGLKADLKKLKNTLFNVKAVILDAEEQQLTNHEVCTWLGQLKMVLFDAEDVFDEFAYEALRKQVVDAHDGVSKKVRRFFSTSSNPIAFRLKMSRKVKEIREAFDEVAANKAKFHFNAHLVADRPPLLKDREMTYSFVDASEIIGRDRDRDVIVQSLMVSPQGPDENVSTISIVGIGGLGKTALAKMVYNHARVVEHFEKRRWVCLGDLERPNVNQVMEKIVGTDNSVESDPERVQNRLRDELQNKRFLLVLDDVWDMDRTKWMDLRTLLMSGASGSKVVVTTRKPSVASNMESVLTHELEGLSHDKCIILFKKYAFKAGEDSQNLMEVGDEIVRKCQGVPLAVKTLGGLLFSKQNKNYWEYVRDNRIWELEQKKDDILPALKLSYDQLPFVLKQCFIYCSIFPKDYEFINVVLIQLWLAFGFLRSSNENRRVEDIGEEYINELRALGFFQDFDKELPHYYSFKMHDLIHDLALFIVHNEFENLNIGSHSDWRGIRHLSFSKSVVGMIGKKVQISLTKNSRHSGVMTSTWSMFFDHKLASDEKIVKQCVSKFKCVRFLDLSKCTSLELLPNSIGTLRHLRYLDLSGCSSLTRLPVSIGKLYNLQTLIVADCDELEELPKEMGELINLRFLAITTKQKHLSFGFERLSSLQSLWLLECENIESVFEGTELDSLTSLRTLMTHGCKSLTSLFPSSTTSTWSSRKLDLSALQTLVIGDCPNINLASDEISCPRLKSLIFLGLPQMESLPQWMFQGCDSTLELLRIEDCENLTSLPEGMQSFTALKELVINDCDELIERCARGRGEDWPNIKHIPKILLDHESQSQSQSESESEDEDDQLDEEKEKEHMEDDQ